MPNILNNNQDFSFLPCFIHKNVNILNGNRATACGRKNGLHHGFMWRSYLLRIVNA